MQETTKSVNNVQVTKTYYWCDSTITLSWIRGHSARWKAFVAHRVTHIHNKTSSKDWYYVSSKENPADLSSRGVSVKQLIESKLWWHGPLWLADPAWTPIDTIGSETQTTEEVLEPSVRSLVMVDNTSHSCADTEELLKRYSSFKQLYRVVAYLRRFLTKESGELRAYELEKAKSVIYRQVQLTEFADEMQHLSKGNPIARQSKLISLNPFIDQNGTLCVGGRLKYASVSTSAKHMIILPSKHFITQIIIEDAHRRLLHGGTQATQAFLSGQYWIINARSKIRQILKQCVTCHRFRTSTSKQLMGQLPPERVTPNPPFSRTGVDYAGPIAIRMSKGRGAKSYKGYICLFVCMTTKAIHLEAVSDLTSVAFIAAYKRFASRRGHCLHIYSDNGPTFVGADKILARELKIAIKAATKEVASLIANDGTTWHFIPPYAPHMGGIWEAGIKSTKYHLKRIVGEAMLTFEELTTVLSQIEACLNSRPLYPTSSDPLDVTALTPGHFLIGRPITAIPCSETAEITITNRWKLISKITEDFWKRWSSEYLYHLQQRQKWVREYNSFKINDLVLIKEENVPPTKWKLGRVTELHPGVDNLVRVVSLKTPNGSIIKRHIGKLSPLPIDTDEKETNQQSSSMLRATAETSKSLKNARSNRISGNMFLTLLTLMLLIFGCTANPPALGAKVIPIQTSGLMFAHYRTSWIRQGTWHLMINTTRNSMQDILMVKDCATKLTQMCQTMEERNYRVGCNNIVTNLHLSANRTKQRIFQLLRQRSKRSRGLVPFLADLLFGSSDRDEIDRIANHQSHFAKASSGVLKATLETVEKIKNSTVTRLKNFEDKLNELIRFMNHERMATDQTFMEVQFIHAFESAKSVIDTIWTYYEQYYDLSIITEDELHTLMSQIQLRIPVTTKIHEAFSQQSYLHLCKHRLKVINDTVVIIIDIPIISIYHYEIFKVISVPDMYNHRILKTQHEYIGVNHETLSFFYPNIVDYDIQLTEDEWIYSNVVLYQGTMSFDCVAASIFRRTNQLNQLCKLDQLPDEFDEWITIPGGNKYIYYTTKVHETAFICNGTREETKHKVALLKLGPGCHVSTWKRKILSTTDISSTIYNNFFHPHSISDLINQTLPINLISVLADNTTSNTSKDIARLMASAELLANDRDISSKESSISIVHIIWGSITVTLLIMLIFILGYAWYRWNKKGPANNMNDQGRIATSERSQPLLRPNLQSQLNPSAIEQHRRSWPRLSIRCRQSGDQQGEGQDVATLQQK